MKRLGILALVLIFSVTLCFSSMTVNAEEYFDIVEVSEEELGIIEEESELFDATAADAVCYIGEDEASRVYYATIVDAVKATNNSSKKTIHLMKDATWSGYTYDGNGYGAHHKVFVLEGHGYTLTLAQQIHVSLDSDFTFNDVTVNLASSYSILIGCNGKLTLGDKTTVTGRTTDGYAVGLENRNGSGGTLTMLPGSKITGNKANVLGAVYAGCAGTINIEGEITGNTSGAGAIRVNSSGVTVNVGKNANITGNTSKNFVPLATTTFNVASDFEGTVGVSYGKAGEAIGNVAEGADVSGITLDGTETVATNKNGVLTWETEAEAADKNTVCYIGEDVAGKRYASIHEAVAVATSGSTIFVKKDITWDNVTTYYNKNITIKSADSAKKKITMPSSANLKITGESGNVTFENITLDFNFNGKHLEVDDYATVKLVGADILNGKGGVGGTVLLGAGTTGHLVMDENSTLSGRATGGDGNIGAVVHIHGTKPTSTFTMNGGTIINYDTTRYAVSQYSGTGNIIISKNATIVNGTSTEATPVTGTKNAIRLKDTTNLIVRGDFTGDIKVNYGSIGDKFGTAEDGATISGSLTNYSTGKSAAIKNGDLIWDYACYVGTDVAANRYYTLNEALRGTKSTVYMVRDAEWDPALDANTGTMANLVTTLNGNGYTLTPTKDIRIAYNTKLTFEDVTVDMDGKIFRITDGAEITLNDGAHFINGGSGLGQGGTFTTWGGHSIKITMNEGSSITGSSAEYGGAMLLANGAKFIMNGGEISGNWAKIGGFGGAIKVDAGASVTVSGNAKIEGNKSGSDWNTAMEDNLFLASPNELTVNAGFTGHIGINYEANSSEGKAVAKAGSGLASLPSVKSITNDRNAYHFGWINSEGNIIWQLAPQIAPTLQYGTYAEGTKGIVRFTNKFAAAPANAKVTKFGTYILDNASFSEEDLAATDNKFVKTETSVLASGKGFITDLHTGNLEKSYTASSFCYIEGINAPVYVTAVAEAINSVEEVIELSDETVAGYESLYEN